MTETVKRVIAVAVVAVLAVIVVYGSYLPYRKSRDYVAAITATEKADSFQSFVTPYLQALEDTSPVGQEETTRNFAQTVSGILTNIPAGAVNQNTRTVVQALGALVDKFALPVIERKSSASQAQTYYIVASTYLRLYQITEIPAYRNRARDLLREGLALSPDRPQFLYALVEYESRYGTKAQARQYAQRVLELWPDDAEMKTRLSELD